MTGWVLVTAGVLGLIASAFLDTPLLLVCFALIFAIGMQELRITTKFNED